MSDLSSKLRVTVREMRDGALMPCRAVFCEILNAADEIDRLQAIVDQLPKTEDGVPIYPGMTVWALIPGCEISDVEAQAVGIGGVWRYCYSTREAAEKARAT